MARVTTGDNPSPKGGRVVGVCRLHRGQTEILRNSHAVAAWAYRRQLQGDPGSSQLVLLERGTARLSNDQRREYLLCADCEQKIGRWEKYVSGVARQVDGAFPALKQAEPMPTLSGMHRLALNTEVVTRFALSTFWRASISARFPDFRLDPRGEEQLRQFLNDDAKLPADMRLALTLLASKETPVDQLVSAPSQRRLDGFCREYVFIILGMHFVLVQGSKLPLGYDTLCYARTGLVTISTGETLGKRVAELGESATIKGRLAKRFAD